MPLYATGGNSHFCPAAPMKHGPSGILPVLPNCWCQIRHKTTFKNSIWPPMLGTLAQDLKSSVQPPSLVKKTFILVQYGTCTVPCSYLPGLTYGRPTLRYLHPVPQAAEVLRVRVLVLVRVSYGRGPRTVQYRRIHSSVIIVSTGALTKQTAAVDELATKEGVWNVPQSLISTYAGQPLNRQAIRGYT